MIPTHDEQKATPVTDKRRCYIFICAGCGLLADSTRSDALTCSTRCRVRAHRSGELKRLRADAEQNGGTAAEILQGAAADALRPDLVDRVIRGDLSRADIQPEVVFEYLKLIRDAYEATS